MGLRVHEIMRAMGFPDHPDMASAISCDRTLTGRARLVGHVLCPLDCEAMVAAFTRLGPGDPYSVTIGPDRRPGADERTRDRRLGP